MTRNRFALLALSFSACTQTITTDSGENAELVLDTPGTEQMARVKFVLPTGACLPGGTCSAPLAYAPVILIDDKPATLNVVGRFAPGDHTLSIDGMNAPITLTLGNERTVVLPIAKRTCTRAPAQTVANINLGPRFDPAYGACPDLTGIENGNLRKNPEFGLLRFYASTSCAGGMSSYGRTIDCPSNQVFNSWAVGGRCINQHVNVGNICPAWFAQTLTPHPFYSLTGYAAVPPSTLQFRVKQPNGADLWTNTAMAEGDIRTIELTLPQLNAVPPTWTTKLDVRDAAQLNTLATHNVAITSPGCGNNYTLTDTTIGAKPVTALIKGECNYTLNVGGRKLPLTQQDSTVALHRLDVNHPVVTREDGTTYQAHGTFAVYFQGQEVIGTTNTGNGLYMLAGEYEVVVKYTTLLGPQTVRHRVVF